MTVKVTLDTVESTNCSAPHRSGRWSAGWLRRSLRTCLASIPTPMWSWTATRPTALPHR